MDIDPECVTAVVPGNAIPGPTSDTISSEMSFGASVTSGEGLAGTEGESGVGVATASTEVEEGTEEADGVASVGITMGSTGLTGAEGL